MTIKSKLLLALVPSILLVFVIFIYVTYHLSSNILIENIKNETINLAKSYSLEFDELAESSKKVAQGMSNAISIMPQLNDNFIKNLIRKNLEENPDIYGSTIAFLPNETPFGRYSPYFYKSDKGIKYESLANLNYDYTKWEWFKIPIGEGFGSWGEPYFDKGGGNVMMTTFSQPIYKSRKIIGIATVDIKLNYIVNKIKTLKIGNTGFAFIVSKNGNYLAHPKVGFILRENIFKQAEMYKDPDLDKLVAFIKNGDSSANYMGDPFSERKTWIFTTPIKSTGWMLIINYPQDEILAPVSKLSKALDFTTFLIIGLIIILIMYISSSITSPIASLVNQAQQYAKGNFAIRLNSSKGPIEIRELSQDFNIMGEAIGQKINEIVETKREIIFRLGLAAEYRDTDTGLHIRRMSQYCEALARAFGLSEKECELILRASPMHDIGKIGIPDSILLKKGRLDPDEIDVMKTHTTIGAKILSGSNSELLNMAMEIALTHHEKWGGGGYPRDLKGEDIPITGRIAAVCDVFDSLTSERPYKKAWPVSEAMDEITKKSGIDFDPKLVEIFVKILPEILKIKESFK